MKVFFRQNSVPANSCLLFRTKAEAQMCKRGDLRLAFCALCGFISNVSFEPRLTEYSGRYEETQGFSPTFRSFHEQLARDLVGRHDLREKRVLEIGCGKGEFLELLWSLGGNHCVGFDPSYVHGRLDKAVTENIQVIVDFYSEKYANYTADFICCKMTLEHILVPATILSPVLAAAKRNPTIVFFQVPESTRIFQTCAFEDIYYEHCSYFTPGSLGRLFRFHGFTPLRVATEYDRQYLTIEATTTTEVPAIDGTDDVEEVSSCIEAFQDRYQEKVLLWRSQIEEANHEVVLWGSGSKAVSFLTALGVDTPMRFVVDINPNKQGHFMPGSAQEIVSPTALQGIRPGLVIVMNPVYIPEIRRTLSALGLSPIVVSL